MATNFPGSQDSFTNPTSSDTLDSPDHAAQHANVNDAVEAIELALLDGAPLKIDDSNERVGIGTTSPDVPLDISGSSSTQFIGSRIINTNNTAGAEAVLKFEVLDQEGHIGLERPEADVGADMYFSTTDAGASSPFAPTERMRITQDGKVGINDTTPSYTLDVNGDIRTTGAFYVGSIKQGDWQTYNPTLSNPDGTSHYTGSSSGSWGTPGVHAQYAVSGDIVFVQIYTIYGSGSSTNKPMWSLPYTAKYVTGSLLSEGLLGHAVLSRFMNSSDGGYSFQYNNSYVGVKTDNLTYNTNWFSTYTTNAITVTTGSIHFSFAYLRA